MRTITTLVIPLLLIGCASSTAGRADRGETNVPSDLVIEFGEGGGMTGLWSGFTLQASGRAEPRGRTAR